MADFGLFGPDSVTWRVHTDPVLAVAGFYALAVQSLQPPAMWGTYQNSSLFDRQQAFARLMRTGDFVAVRTFGSTAEVDQIGRRVRKIHTRLRGHNPDTGEEFRVDEPENLLWVHCGEIIAYLRVAQRAGILVTDAEADAYVDEQRRAAAVVGLDPAGVPGSVAELDAYFQRMLPLLRLTEEARAGFRIWANAPVPLWLAPLKVVYPTLAALAFALLPGWARGLYGLPPWEYPLLDAPATAALRALRLAMLATPERLRAGSPIQRRYTNRALRLMRADRPVPAAA
ncbi:oxygenase MpaB family protein [Pseudonocardia sp. Cha107L01]|jgi:uncharacterized protein (DUF2236 family)|uniref:oxygenase MpaB family protein n=1 Tax=Pseudonocardia sp. Cha107L01 TaxID=3457576 RepID=UPI00403E578A